jgi:signal peptidase I
MWWVVKVIVLSTVMAANSLAALTLIWIRYEGRILNVRTGSMQPTINPGDVVMAEKINPLQLRPGDIVSYHSLQNPKVIITHRLVAVDSQTDKLIMQGDKLDTPDPAIPASSAIGRVRWFIPRLGHVFNLLTHPLGLALLIYVPVAGLLTYEINRFARRRLSRYRHTAYKR